MSPADLKKTQTTEATVQVYRLFERWMNLLYKTAGLMSVVTLILMTCLVLAQIVLRLFDLEIPSSEDFAGYLLIGVTSFGYAYALSEGAHIKVEIIEGTLGKRARRNLKVFGSSVSTCVAAYLSYYFFLFAKDSYRFADKSFGEIPVSLWIPQSLLVIGMAMLALGFFHQLIHTLLEGSECELE